MKHKFKVGETYKNRGGQKVKILANYSEDPDWCKNTFPIAAVVEDPDGYSHFSTLSADGRWDPEPGKESQEDLILPEPVKYRGIINIYPDNSVGQFLYLTPEEAARSAMSDRVASVWVECVEGEFAEEE